MLPPRRNPRRTWNCKTCGAELGAIGVTSRSHILHPTGLTNARPDPQQPGVWWLRCNKGHETRWAGEFTLTVKEAA